MLRCKSSPGVQPGCGLRLACERFRHFHQPSPMLCECRSTYFQLKTLERKPRMETEGRYTLVGTLVLAVIALLTLAIVWLAGAADHIAYQTYSLYFKQQSLDGWRSAAR